MGISECVNKSKILFIGAGATLGARAHLSTRPPLGLELLGWLRTHSVVLQKTIQLIDVHGIITEASKILAQHSKVSSFEEFLPLLEGHKERESIHRLLQIAFSDLTDRRFKGCTLDLGFKNQNDNYDDLIKKLEINDTDWSVVSLNYDYLFEESLRRVSKEFFYPKVPFQYTDDQTNAKGVAVFKPHGSINFFAQPHHVFSHGGQLSNHEHAMPTKFNFINDQAIPNYPIVYAALPGADNVISRAGDAITKPIIANYTLGKAADINDSTLGGIRELVAKACLNAKEIVIIGVKPITDSNDDHVVSNILETKFSKVTYVTRGDIDAQEVLKVYPHAEVFTDGLGQFLTKK